jgi:hypothetical protein
MKYSRRNLLASVGLGAAFLPLLQTRAARAQAGFPRRLVIMQWTNGIINGAYWPGGGEHDFTLSETLKPLEPFRRDIIVLGGVGLRNQKDTKAQGAGVGHQSLWALLTGVQGAQGRNDGGPCGIANGISVDQHVANAIAKRAPNLKIKSLELGAVTVSGKDNERSISYRGPAVGGRPADNPPEINSYKVWDRLFKDLPSVPNTGTPGMDSELFARIRAERKSVLDFVGREMSALKGRLATDDATKLDQHLTAMRSLEKELLSLEAAAPGAGCTPTRLPLDLPYSRKDQVQKMVPVQLDLAALALRCDLTRVVTIMMCNSANDGLYYPFLGSEFPATGKYLEGDHHGISHAAGDNTGSADGRKKIKIDQWWMSQFAGMLQRLKSTPEGDGTMLDNTLVVMANHMSTGAGHGTAAGIPFVLAGHCQGYFKTGRWLSQHAKDTPHNRILVAIANAMLAGHEPPLTHFGDPQYGGELAGIRG